MKKYVVFVENCRKIFRIIGVLLGVWGIFFLVISYSSLKDHYQYSINHNQNVNTQIKFFFQMFVFYLYGAFLPLATSFFLLLITKKKN